MSPVPAHYQQGQTWICFFLLRVHLDPCYWSRALQQAPRPLRLCFLVGTSPEDGVQKGVLCLISISYGERCRARTVRCGTRAWRGTVTFRAQLHGHREGVLFSYPITFAPSSRNGRGTSLLGFSVDWATLENEAPWEDGHPLLRVVGRPRV